MSPIPYFILAYVLLGLQLGLGAAMRLGSAWPNFVLLGVIYIALNAPRDAAVLGAFGLGALQDLLTEQPLGLFALSYGLIAMFVVGSAPLVERGHPLTQAVLTLIGGLATTIVLLLQGVTRGPVRPDVGPLLGMTLYTTALAPVVLGVLHRIRRSFSFQSRRRRMRL